MASTPLTPHEKAINESLTRAGIGSAYHNVSLSSIPNGQTLIDWIIEQKKLKKEGLQEGLDGKGWNIVGSSLAAREATILLARGAHLSGFGAYVTSLLSLDKVLKVGDHDELELIEERDVLAIVDFDVLYGKTAMLDEDFYTRRRVENLLKRRWDKKKSNFLRFNFLPQDCREGWTEELTLIAMDKNKLFRA